LLTVHKSDGKTAWVDLCEPTDEELAQACRDFGLDIPPRAQLEEIEADGSSGHFEGLTLFLYNPQAHQ